MVTRMVQVIFGEGVGGSGSAGDQAACTSKILKDQPHTLSWNPPHQHMQMGIGMMDETGLNPNLHCLTVQQGSQSEPRFLNVPCQDLRGKIYPSALEVKIWGKLDFLDDLEHVQPQLVLVVEVEVHGPAGGQSWRDRHGLTIPQAIPDP
ncbi:hypothetical protein J6590_059525 [Homalodisca vitripennis]|nr:hypothetical protein J6590_059525 [Homalodisca vitripennis]